MDEIRVGVIGVGYLGKFHAEKYAAMDNVRLVGVADIDQSRAEDLAARLGSRAYAHYLDLLSHVDAVSIVVPTESHFSVGLECLNHGVDVLIEKPMTATLEQADKLIDVAESRDRILQVGHLERFNPAVLALKDVITNPMFIEAHRLSIFKDRSTDVSVVLDLMIHDIDIILNIVKSEIQSIHAAGVPVICEHADIANVRLQFESGCVANVTASRISTKNQRKIRLFQKDAYISVDFTTREITLIRRDENNSDSLVPGTDFQQLSFTEADVLENELASYIQAVRTRNAPVVSGHAGRKALAVALDIMDQVAAAIEKYL
ncbi:Oxidoreductase, Gfo/Idh/MocA family [Olavius sp. associated proteobacterium Delta 1]|nr:Oxidoreductase, Gfo/Idh/MocA family [Olavius sp. associated proteobacterium Delta 1]